MKKTLSLLLVFALMLSILVIPASANGDGISPCVEVAQCPSCSYPSSETKSEYRSSSSVSYCDYESSSHYHTNVYVDAVYIVCNKCGFKSLHDKGSVDWIYCTYAPGGIYRDYR